ncbi:hypothetical protein AAHE18_05G147700 [Arachis hypogaea]
MQLTSDSEEHFKNSIFGTSVSSTLETSSTVFWHVREVEPANPNFIRNFRVGFNCSSTLQIKSLGVRDSNVVEEEIEDRIEVRGGVSVEKLREHVEDSSHCSTDLTAESGVDRRLGFTWKDFCGSL